jgi:hypothetical protein
MAEFFRPVWCDQDGNTYYPYILKGEVRPDGYTVDVHEPAEFVAKWPTVATSSVARCDETEARELSPDEVKRFVAMGQVSLRAELFR